jgi:poly(A) polymerase
MRRLFEAFEKAGKELFLVGGAVRDIALGIPLDELDDLDFCTNARPEESLRIIKGAGLPHYEMGFEFGTVGAVLKGKKSEGYPKDCQVTTYRSAEYYRRGSRHPQVKFGDTIEQDLGRRDFSINSMAIDRDRNFIDPYGGLDDLERGLLRVVGDPLETLAEDPLRILRVARFVSRLGFDVDPALFLASLDRATGLLDISRERWLQEMDKILLGAYVAEAMEFLFDVGVLGLILPEVAVMRGFHESSPVHHKDLWDHTMQVVLQTPEVPAMKWAGLLHDIGKVWTRRVDEEAGQVAFHRHEEQGALLFEGIARRFKLDRATTAQVAFLIEHHGRAHQYSSEWSDGAVRRFVRDMDPYLESILTFARADLTTRNPERRREILAQVEELTERIEELEAASALRPDLPKGLGTALISAFSLKPSPIVGELKTLLEERIMEGLLESGQSATYYVEALAADPPELLQRPDGST